MFFGAKKSASPWRLFAMGLPPHNVFAAMRCANQQNARMQTQNKGDMVSNFEFEAPEEEIRGTKKEVGDTENWKQNSSCRPMGMAQMTSSNHRGICSWLHWCSGCHEWPPCVLHINYVLSLWSWANPSKAVWRSVCGDITNDEDMEWNRREENGWKWGDCKWCEPKLHGTYCSSESWATSLWKGCDLSRSPKWWKTSRTPSSCETLIGVFVSHFPRILHSINDDVHRGA